MTIVPFALSLTCPKCAATFKTGLGANVNWHTEGTCPKPMAYYMHDTHTERIPPGLPEHLHVTCFCGFFWLMKPADARGPEKCPKCGTGDEGHLCP